MQVRRPISLVFLGSAGLMCGCFGGDDLSYSEPDLYPVIGKVTVQGEPLPEAVVTFLQVDEQGTLAVAETEEDGSYVLSHSGRPGAGPGRYKVVISYLVGTDGTVYGLGPRSSLAKPYGMFSAKELLPPKWSDFGEATTIVEVTDAGGVFDFDIKDPLLPPPEPEASDESEAEEAQPDTEADEPEKVPDEPSPTSEDEDRPDGA